MFSRTLGNTFGVAALGAVVNFGVISYANRAGAILDADQTRRLLGEIGNVLGGAAEPALRGALDSALRTTFVGMLVFAAISAGLALLVPVLELDSLFSEKSSNPPRSPAAGQNQKVDAC
jgi:hypothetical protein